MPAFFVSIQRGAMSVGPARSAVAAEQAMDGLRPRVEAGCEA